MKAFQRPAWALPIAILGVIASAYSAHATIGNGTGPSRGVNGNSDGKTLSASVTNTNIKITTSDGRKIKSRGNISSVDTNWTPPVCWYEPVATPKQFKSSVEQLKKTSNLAPVATYLEWAPELFEKYYGKKSEYNTYDDYNMAEQGQGKWWRGVINPNRESEYDEFADGCADLMFWVPDGTTPKAAEAVSPKILAGYAYDSIKVPDTKVKMNPDGKQTVNLATWIWLNKARFKPVSVTARLPGTNLWATTTAKPVSLHIAPGTTDATVFPSSGGCPIDANGQIGTPYVKDDAGDPPCGVTYQRMTSGTPFALKTTLTWQISWKGTGNTGGDLPDGTFGTTTDVTVQEIQTVNR